MNLSDFIHTKIELILNEWEKFASGIFSARGMNKKELRDHAREILNAIAADLNSTETPHEQAEKSKGRGPRSAGDTYAAMHGIARESQGFSVNDTLSEFRALRASVLRIWVDSNKIASLPSGEEIVRFNEAIDQALTESIEQYSTDLVCYSRLFDALLSSSLDHSCIFDVDGRLIYANELFASFYGILASEIIGKNFFDLCFSNASATVASYDCCQSDIQGRNPVHTPLWKRNDA
jgi:PAS domain-containing protein